jgi:hypothetical protein
MSACTAAVSGPGGAERGGVFWAPRRPETAAQIPSARHSLGTPNRQHRGTIIGGF